jgi:hypothetical protein
MSGLQTKILHTVAGTQKHGMLLQQWPWMPLLLFLLSSADVITHNGALRTPLEFQCTPKSTLFQSYWWCSQQLIKSFCCIPFYSSSQTCSCSKDYGNCCTFSFTTAFSRKLHRTSSWLPLKRRYVSTGLHGAAARKTAIFILTAVRTSTRTKL